MRILIVDDHAIVRKGFQRIIEQAYPDAVVHEANDGLECLERVCKEDYDIVVLDISLPAMNGIDTLKAILAEPSPPAVLMLTIHPETQYAVRVLRAGAAGYLTKDRAPEELLAAIERIMSGGRYITPSLAERLADPIGTRGEMPHEQLSDREYQVLLGLANGMTVTQIAGKHRLSVKTISTYRTRLLRKLDMATNADLTQYCLGAGLIG